MAFTWIIIVLLTVVVVAKSSMIMDAVGKLNGARNNQCARNNYRNDPDLFSVKMNQNFKENKILIIRFQRN